MWACLILFKDVEYRSQFPVERLDDCCQRYCRVVERLSWYSGWFGAVFDVDVALLTMHLNRRLWLRRRREGIGRWRRDAPIWARPIDRDAAVASPVAAAAVAAVAVAVAAVAVAVTAVAVAVAEASDAGWENWQRRGYCVLQRDKYLPRNVDDRISVGSRGESPEDALRSWSWLRDRKASPKGFLGAVHHHREDALRNAYGSLKNPQRTHKDLCELEVRKNFNRSTRVHKNPQESARIHKNPQESTRIHKNPQESARIRKNPPSPKGTSSDPPSVWILVSHQWFTVKENGFKKFPKNPEKNPETNPQKDAEKIPIQRILKKILKKNLVNIPEKDPEKWNRFQES